MKRFWILGIITFFLFVILISVESGQSTEIIDWRPNFSRASKDPYGSLVLYERLPDLFPENTVESSRYTAYELCWESQQQAFNYILINQYFEMNPTDVRGLLEFVAIGGQAFIAAERFRGLLADTLKLSTNYIHRKDRPDSLVGVRVKKYKQSIDVNMKLMEYYLDTQDMNDNLEVLASTEENLPVLLRVPFFDGAFFISSNPLLFTNYNLLKKDGSILVEKSLNQLPLDDVFWDEYYKIGRGEEQSPFRFILGRKSLRAAFYTLCFGIFLFIIFEGRRKQRPIPVVKDPPNVQLDFAKVLGRLYYNEGQHLHLAQKQVNHLREELKNRFYTAYFPESEDDYDNLTAKTGVEKTELKSLFGKISQLDKADHLSEAELLRLHEALRPFYGSKKITNQANHQ